MVWTANASMLGLIRHGGDEGRQRRRDAVQRHGLGEQPRIPRLVSAPPGEEALELRLDGAAALERLLLQASERRQFSLGGDDRLDLGSAERPHELCLQVAIAHEDLVEHALEVTALAGIHEPDDAVTREGLHRAPRALGPADDPKGRHPSSESRRERLEGDPITLALDQHDHG